MYLNWPALLQLIGIALIYITLWLVVSIFIAVYLQEDHFTKFEAELLLASRKLLKLGKLFTVLVLLSVSAVVLSWTFNTFPDDPFIALQAFSPIVAPYHQVVIWFNLVFPVEIQPLAGIVIVFLAVLLMFLLLFLIALGAGLAWGIVVLTTAGPYAAVKYLSINLSSQTNYLRGACVLIGVSLLCFYLSTLYHPDPVLFPFASHWFKP